MNLAAVEALSEKFGNLDLIFVESGGDNLSATFSPELADLTIYVIDVAEGEKIPRKGGPGITKSDFLVINKTDLAPYVGASLEVMEREEGKIDLVVSDVVMPEMDGPSLLRELRQTRPDLKIIFVSGYAEDAFKKNLPENEQFNFLPKPFSLKQLATTVKETLAE